MQAPFTHTSCISCLAWLIPLFLPAKTSCQSVALTDVHLTIDHYNADGGYPIGRVISLSHDNLGRVWIVASKADALVYQMPGEGPYTIWRFDGNEFIDFGTPNKDDGTSQRTGIVEILKYWRGDSILVNSDQFDYHLLNSRTGTFARIIAEDGNSRFEGYTISDGVLYLASRHLDTIRIWKEGNGTMKRYADIESPGSQVALAIDDNYIWLSSQESGVSRHHHSGQLLKKYSIADFDATLNQNYSNPDFFVKRDNHEHCYISSLSVTPGILKYNRNEDRFIRIPQLRPIDLPGIQMFDEAGNSLMAFGIQGQYLHVAVFEEDGNIMLLDTILHYLPQATYFYSIDFRTDIWICSDNGLHYVSLAPHATTSKLLQGHSCRAITRKDSATLIVGTEGASLFMLGFDGNRFNIDKHIDNSFENRFLSSDLSGWWTSNISQIAHYGRDDNIIETFSLNYGHAETVQRLSDERFITGHYNGYIEVLDIGNRSSQRVIQSKNLAGCRIHDLLPIDSDRILVAGSCGLHLLSVSTGDSRVAGVTHNEEVLCLEKYSDVIYTGTLSGKVIVNKFYGDSIKYLDAFEIGTPVATITPDSSGHLWLGTFQGVRRLSLDDHMIERVPDILLAHTESNRHSGYFDSLTNRILIGSVDGLTIFDLNTFGAQRDTAPLILLSSATYFNKKEARLTKTPLEGLATPSFVLPAENRYFNVRFHLNQPGIKGSRYVYRMSDQSEWQDIGPEQQIVFHNLNSGTYSLEIRGYTAADIPSSNTARLDLDVRGFFYQSAWFYGAIIIALLLALYLWFRHNIEARKRLESEVQARTRELRQDKETIERQAVELERAATLKDQFFGNISHELKTPLTLIDSPIEQLRKMHLPGNAQYYLDLIKDNSQLLNARVSELLELQRFDSNSVSLNKEVVNLHDTLARVMRVFEPRADEKNIRLSIQNTTPDVNVTMDQGRVTKIIQNLANNAIKFTPEHGMVEVKFEYRQEELICDISDTGIGIDPEHIDHIYDRFYQVPDKETSANPGTGIGLSMVAEYVKLMNGNIEVASIPGQGTRFRLMLPIRKASLEYMQTAPNELEHINTSHHPGPLIENANKPKIIIAEDNHQLREYLSNILSDSYSISACEHGEEVVQLLEEGYKAEIILSDVMMPKMDGAALLQRVRSKEEWRTLPFVFLTAKSNTQFILEMFRTGVDDYLTKPFSESELKARLQAIHKYYLTRVEAQAEEVMEESQNELTLMDRIESIVRSNLQNPEFSTDFIAAEIELSRRHLQRIVKREIGMAPSAFIREIQLDTARSLFAQNGQLTIKEIARRVGYSDAGHFMQLYKERYGTSPAGS